MPLDFAKYSLLMKGMGLVFVLCGVQVFADWALKVASVQGSPFTSRHFFLGMGVYAASAFMWVPVMHYMKLSVLGAFYGVATSLLLAGLGTVVFKEPLLPREWLGIGCAILSMVLMAR